jgi:DNA-binding transcriptional ArsR family regulator
MINYRQPVDRVFHAIGDPTRRAMVEQLSRGPASVSELAKPLGISLPGVVQQLQVLEAAGLVKSEKIGRVRTCRLDRKALTVAERWIAERKRFWEDRLDALGDYLDETKDEKPSRRKP